MDDDGWEPDEDFYVELYEKASGERLYGADAVTRVTILDDDKPGMLVFEEKKAIRHPANEDTCIVTINRIQGTDGEITVKYKTVTLGTENQQAKPGQDFQPVEGTLTFGHNVAMMTISIPIIAREDPDEERDEIFGLKLYGAEPSAVKISKKDTAVIEIVTDADQKRQNEALQ